MSSLFHVAIILVGLLVAIPTIAIAICRLVLFRKAKISGDSRITIGVFHPFCNAGGGGERVLWVALKALEPLCKSSPGLRVVVYTGDTDASPAQILEKAKQRFQIDLTSSPLSVQFAYVRRRHLMNANRWPRFTMLGQSWGSMVVAFEGLRLHRPDVFLDTTGCAFTYIVAKLCAGLKVATYTHYPTLTTDMLNTVFERRPTYNNSAAIANSRIASTAKLIYYKAFAVLYKLAGSLADVVMVNSHWTKAHLDSLWKLGRGGATVVFPPCNTEEFQALPLGGRERSIISVAQFRPEKDHVKQLRAFALLHQKDPLRFGDVRLILLGGARDAEDLARVDGLRALASELKISASVTFMLNVPFSVLQAQLGQSLIGIHTMWCEHFGIGVVEMMAAGVATVAHRSGGPLTDIVVPFHGRSTGWLAATAEEYAQALEEVLVMEPSELLALTARARESVFRFSDTEFERGFVKCFAPVLNLA